MNPERLKSFFDSCPPFSKLNPDERDGLFQTSALRSLPAGEVVFSQGDAPTDQFYLVIEGIIQLAKTENSRTEVIDFCESGVIFGLKAWLAGRKYIYTASAREDSHLLSISYSQFLPLIEKHADVALFFAAGFASDRHQKLEMHRLDEARRLFTQSGPAGFFLDGETIPLSAISPPLECQPDLSIRNAAQIMTESGMNSILVVDSEKRPIGIVTDTDFRSKIGRGQGSIDNPIQSIMSSPVITIPQSMSIASLTLLMMRGGFKHVCITRDGTDRSPAIGILSEHDVLLTQDHNPAVIVREMLNTEKTEALKSLMDRTENLLLLYLRHEISPAFICEVIGEINDVLIQRATRLAIAALKNEGWIQPSYPFSFLSLGSEGRREQLLRTDQDNAILFADPPEGEREAVQSAYLQLGKRIVSILAEAGFELCPGNVMASNPELCQPLSSWKRRFYGWIEEPEAEAILGAAIFFDLRCTVGSTDLAAELMSYVRERAVKGRLFLRLLARDAVRSQPPLGFFRSFLLEKSGEHRNQLDLKLRGLLPLSCAGRLLAFETGYTGTGTTHLRLQHAAEYLPSMRDSIQEAASVYPFLLRLRALNALEHPERKNFINPDELNGFDRKSLKNAFQIIDSLQRDLRGTYQLDELT